MFQKRMRNAGVTATEMHRSIAVLYISSHILLVVPKAPSTMAP